MNMKVKNLRNLFAMRCLMFCNALHIIMAYIWVIPTYRVYRLYDIDELLIMLQSQVAGCHWSHYFAGAFGYADDLVLLAPSVLALRMMLNTCCQFAITSSLI